MKKGFTLIEIMIVVAIIALLAAIAVPGLLRTRLTANEANAIANLRTIATGAETFRTAQTSPIYPASVAALSTPAPPYITGFTGAADPLTKAGYNFSLVTPAAPANINEFTAIAIPTTPGTTGNRRFCIDQTGVMWAANSDFVNTAACAGQGATAQGQL